MVSRSPPISLWSSAWPSRPAPRARGRWQAGPFTSGARRSCRCSACGWTGRDRCPPRPSAGLEPPELPRHHAARQPATAAFIASRSGPLAGRVTSARSWTRCSSIGSQVGSRRARDARGARLRARHRLFPEGTTSKGAGLPLPRFAPSICPPPRPAGQVAAISYRNSAKEIRRPNDVVCRWATRLSHLWKSSRCGASMPACGGAGPIGAADRGAGGAASEAVAALHALDCRIRRRVQRRRRAGVTSLPK